MKSSKLSFVIHKHDATTLHFDFRLEIKGVMSFWAIPKGPTLDPAVKRLAIQVKEQTHQQKYGTGPDEIWDEGEYLPEVEVSKGVREEINDQKDVEKVMSEGLKKGEIKFFLARL